ncbi:hypothetical protein BDV30DRAFT_212440 [Aspergillus minisclerotigenes]|uniref:Uncharacterized protein n=1 Tax=Aspergillus minisclerotigenes TaxID=656917 RepID=A0A5N6J398_9EURO|nr:hypothetical protein BDV30DRAFT_212440 [Aspergillus minisclerotigenes]
MIASQALRFLGRPAEAEAYCLRLRSRGGLWSDEEVVEYGLALFEQEKDEEALSCLCGYPEIEQLAVLLCSLGQHEENIKTYNFASVAERPNLARWLATSHAALGNWPDAELLARVGFAGNPEDQELLSLVETALANENAGTANLSWEFVRAYAEYHGARKVLPFYEEHFSRAADAGYLLFMGERLIGWSVFEVGAPVVPLGTMRDIVDGAAFLRPAANKAFLGHRSEVRRERLGHHLKTLDSHPDRYNRALKEAIKEQNKDDKERRKIEDSLEKTREKAELQRLRHTLPANYPQMTTLSENATTAHNNERFFVYGSGRPG